MDSGSILFISNGHGEDVIAATIIKEVTALLPNYTISGAPLVGVGLPYRAAGVEVIIPVASMPSGGFVKRNFKFLLKDIRAGLLGLVIRQATALREVRRRIELVVGVGDIYPLLMAGLFVKRPLIFIPTAKSDYIAPHLPVEIALMRRWAVLVLPRDERTADSLRSKGVKARYVGNAMMDALTITGEGFGIERGKRVVTLLPGSREEAYDNFICLLEVAESLARMRGGSFEFLAALAPTLELRCLRDRLVKAGWWVEIYEEEDVEGEGRKSPVVATVSSRGQGFEVVVKVVQGMFGDCLKVADIVIGMSGTGNEQAAGLGKPIVTFPGRGPQFTEAFVAVQKRLLGDAIAVVSADPQEVAREAVAILEDAERYRRMQRAGRERMGGGGAARRMAQAIAEELVSRRGSSLPFVEDGKVDD